jgi:type IV pilus assembly protein PilC
MKIINKNWFLNFSTQDRILFAKRLAILLKAGVPILQALQMLRAQSTGKTTMFILDSLIIDIANGQLLSFALERHARLLGYFTISIIRVGEVSGTLYENLLYAAEELKKRQQLKKKIASALVYPLFIVVATVGMSGMLTLYVFPKILPVFKSFHFALPLSTRILIFISETVSRHFIVLSFMAFLIFACSLYSFRKPAVRYMVDRLLLRIPLIGSLFQNYFLANMFRTLGLLLHNNVPIVDAVRMAANTAASLIYQKEMVAMSEYMVRGEQISEYLLEHVFLFPPLTQQMVAVGEMTGDLSGSFLYLADIYEQELDDQTKTLSSLIEPVLMVGMGLVVGFVAVSIITPIYEITQNLHP